MITPLHEGISVPDMDAAIRWYQRAFGFHLQSDKVLPALNSRVVFLELDGFQLELFQYLGTDGHPLPPERREPNEDLKTCGVKHVAYQVDDLAKLMAHLEDMGADVAMAPFEMGSNLVCFVRDCSGSLIELIQCRPAPCEQQKGSMSDVSHDR